MYRPLDLHMMRIGRAVVEHLPLSAYRRARLKSWLKSAFALVRYRQLYVPRVVARLRGGVVGPLAVIPHRPRRSRTSASPGPEHIEASIVIPVYNQLQYTLRCLDSIRDHTHEVAYEVIVVDDCSTDDTQATLSGRDDIRYLRNPSNVGFVGSCNAGAAAAHGEFVVMLNNDTEVRANWLLELVDTFHAIPEAGLVGAKLLYPDGRLQEAGGIVWQDGSAWNYGRGQDPSRPECNYLREVDYVSGACIALRKSLWDALGGFDTHFAPAYGEDSDLAFRVRTAGRRVYYQPMAEVVHYEGVSCGTEVTSGLKAYQVENARKLFERWQEVLQSHRPNGAKPELEKERRVQRRLLVIDAITPMPDHDAGSITALGILELGQQLGFKVSFVPESNFTWIQGYSDQLARKGIESLVWPPYRSVREVLAARGKELDAVLLFRSSIAAQYMDVIRELAPQARLAFHASDLHFLREQREADLGGSAALRRQAAQTRDLETHVVSSVDCTIVHSSEEKRLLETLAPGAHVVLFPWMLDSKPDRPGFPGRRDLMFVGGYGHPPNVDAVEFFVREIWALVRARLPDARFYIVGSYAPESFRALAGNGVEVVGFVEDLEELMGRCVMTVVPLRYGAGIKGKIGTSMSYGLPVVTTSIGAEGMDLVHGEHALVADEPKAFADAVVTLYRDQALWERLSQASIDYVDRMYSRRRGLEIMREVLGVDAG